MDTPITPPATPAAPQKSSPHAIRIWAISATVAAGLFAVLALIFFVQAQAKLMPVYVTFIKSNSGPLFARLANVSPRSIKVLVQLQSRTTGESMQEEFVVEINRSVDIGREEGWHFVSGDTLRIRHVDYRNTVVTVPNFTN